MNGRTRAVLWGALLAAVLAISPFRPLKISGRSMEPTLHNGETYLLDQAYWKPSGLRRMDIVVVRHGQEYWVKRLFGMPGDRLQIARRPDGWITQVRNLTSDKAIGSTEDELEERLVEAGEIFVIGDNLNRSADSTNQEAGSFKLADVQGVVRTFGLSRDFRFREHHE
jgi:signal peptidase I